MRGVARIENPVVGVAKWHQHDGARDGGTFRQCQMRRHEHAGLRLEDDVLKAEAVALDCSSDSGVERSPLRHPAKRVKPPRMPRRLLRLQIARRADRRHGLVRRNISIAHLVEKRRLRGSGKGHRKGC